MKKAKTKDLGEFWGKCWQPRSKRHLAVVTAMDDWRDALPEKQRPEIDAWAKLKTAVGQIIQPGPKP